MKPHLVVLLAAAAVFATEEGLLGQQMGEGDRARQLVWVDRSGEVLETVGPRMSSILDPSISPDGDRVAVRGRENRGDRDHLWILEGTSANRLTTNEGWERHMIWSPDGSRIAYSIQK